MEPYQERVVEEADELKIKLTRLEDFLDGPVFAGLSNAERRRLESQAHYMTEYWAILQTRIAAF